ncbi:hypothetical protein DID73_01705 [Candidatus Marinamargulisbacteria bacterium SCGC AG-343-K17]|nr:hypothetical protein DID73_01705 [Candidatus Marinamargulisbacteria bacterium SCGC AG-343-K17]
MRKTIITLLIFISPLFAADSLYSDDIQEAVDLEKQQLQEAYDYSEDTTKKNQSISYFLDNYMTSIFTLSQLTSGLAHITDESKIYSDINRLDRICMELTQLLDGQSINFKFKPVGTLSKIQSYYQQTLYKLHVISPYMPTLLDADQKKASYYVEYIYRITNQIQSNIQKMIAIKQQLNQGTQSPLPFSPQTPQQLSFALENQLSSSLINMINSDSGPAESGMPFSSLSTPANADMFNQSAVPQGLPNVPSPNASPLQMMNYMPSF